MALTDAIVRRAKITSKYYTLSDTGGLLLFVSISMLGTVDYRQTLVSRTGHAWGAMIFKASVRILVGQGVPDARTLNGVEAKQWCLPCASWPDPQVPSIMWPASSLFRRIQWRSDAQNRREVV